MSLRTGSFNGVSACDFFTAPGTRRASVCGGRTTGRIIMPPDPGKDFYNQADNLVFWGRMPILLLGLGLAVLVFSWSREWFGLAGGILSLALFCFDPTLSLTADR